MEQQQKPKAMKIKRLDPYADLPRATRKKVIRLVKLAKLNGTIPRSVQQGIPYLQMLRNGLCQVEKDYYTRMLEFQDINYRLAKQEDQQYIFECWSKFLNFFDPSVTVQLSFINETLDLERFYEAIDIPTQGDELDTLRDEYVGMLKAQLQKGNNGLAKRKFITFGVKAETQELATMRLERMELELINNFKLMGVQAQRQNGYQRMELLHNLLNIGTERKLNFNWNLIPQTGLSTKDFLAPAFLDLREKSRFGLEKRIGRVSQLHILAPELSDELLSDFLDLGTPLVATLHIQSIDQGAAMKQVKDLIASLQQMKITEQMKAARSGYDMDILPPDLVTYSAEAQELLEDLQSRNERMFLVTFLLCNFAQEEEELENTFFTASQIAQKYNCTLMPLEWQQEAGFTSTLPLGKNTVEIRRMLTTASAAIFIPFQTQELFMPNGLYYGVNAVSQNMLLVDRTAARSPNALLLGTPGSGKSFSSKREIINVLLCTDDDILILDPEQEYSSLVQAFGGQVIKISADSSHHINPMDLRLNVRSEEDKDYDPVRAKSDFLMSFCEQIIASRNGLEPIEKTVIDRSVQRIYAPYLKTQNPEDLPILKDLYDCLLQQPEQEAQRIATGLELYVTGSQNIFNHRTNVDIQNRLVCFDIKDLGTHLKKLGMLTVQDQIWGRVTENRSRGRRTRYYVDEFHLLLKEEQTAEASIEIWKRFRKWGGIPTGITQNVKDFLNSPKIEVIFENSDFIYLLNQAPGDRAILAQRLSISEHQMGYVTNAQPGHGLVYFNGVIIPFVDEFPQDTQLYKLMTTKPEEVGK